MTPRTAHSRRMWELIQQRRTVSLDELAAAAGPHPGWAYRVAEAKRTRTSRRSPAVERTRIRAVSPEFVVDVGTRQIAWDWAHSLERSGVIERVAVDGRVGFRLSRQWVPV